MSKKSTAEAFSRSLLFGPPLILDGEDSSAYDELLGRLYAAVKPVDVIDEIWITDAAALEWDVLRWRRLKFSLLPAHARQALTEFLDEHMEYNLYQEEFAEDLTRFLDDVFVEHNVQDSAARKLARDCARDQKEAVAKVRQILAQRGTNLGVFDRKARNKKAEEFAQAYLRREKDAVNLVNKHLENASVTIDELMAKSMQKHGALDYIERLDRLITIAENRRNSSLREIDRRRVTLGEAVRRTLQKIEADDLKVIEATPAKRKNAA